MHDLETILFPHDLSEFTEVIDVRSPAEYALDHLPGAINLPVLNDEERVVVGTLYKDNPFEARKIGAALISENVAQHLKLHLANFENDYRPLLYCWRGGMRSRSMTMILKSIGWKAHLIQGGYRTFRQYVVKDTERIFREKLNLQVLSGLTGVGKTRLLKAIIKEGGQVIDLEGLANHKGSLLGADRLTEQPTQKMFETRLWEIASKLDLSKPIFLEAESNRIGNVHCPSCLWTSLSEASVTHINLPIKDRIKLLLEDYPDFIEYPAELSKLLDVLVRLRGKEQVGAWKELIDTRRWTDFVESILINHYDLCYRQPGDPKSNYQAVSRTVNVVSICSDDFRAAALEVIAKCTD